MKSKVRHIKIIAAQGIFSESRAHNDEFAGTTTNQERPKSSFTQAWSDSPIPLWLPNQPNGLQPVKEGVSTVLKNIYDIRLAYPNAAYVAEEVTHCLKRGELPS